MGWWHRDSSLWCRSALHRYARRALRDNGAALRGPRCYSKPPPQPAADRKEGEEQDRPPHLTDLQWMQLRQYRRWTRRLEEHPYRMLFGASNDMLQGKGLKNWEWVYKVFPKWMLKDMDASSLVDLERERQRQTKGWKDETSSEFQTAENNPRPASHWSTGRTSSSTSTSPPDTTYPKKVNIENDRPSSVWGPRTLSHIVESSRNSSGVASPSDPRRPREYGEVESSRRAHKDNTPSSSRHIPSMYEDASSRDTYRRSHTTSPPENIREDSAASRKEASAREAAFIKEFLEDTGRAESSERPSKDWRQTVLERRASSGRVPLAPKNESNSMSSPREDQDDESQNRPTPKMKHMEQPGQKFWPAMSNRGQSSVEAQTPLSSESPAASGEDGGWDPKDFKSVQENTARFAQVSNRHSETGDWTQTTLEAPPPPSVRLHIPGMPISSVTPEMEKAMEELARKFEPRMESNTPSEVRKSDGGSPWYSVRSSETPGLMVHDEHAIPIGRPEWRSALRDEDYYASTTESAYRERGAKRTATPVRQKSTSEVLGQLPEDDIDFLSASDIRASMGTRKSKKESPDVTSKSRQELETEFKNAHKEDPAMHPMVEAMILNNAHVRRLENQLKEKGREIAPLGDVPVRGVQSELKEEEKEPAIKPCPAPTMASTTNLESESVLETSLNRMTKWLEAGSDALAKHFWSDPIREGDSKGGASLDPLLANIGTGLQKARNAIEGVTNELAVDIPGSSPLLKRLMANERDVFATLDGLFRFQRYQQDASSETLAAPSAEKRQSQIRRLRQDLKKTEEEYEEACRSFEGVWPPATVSAMVARRLSSGADLLQKNAKLTRRLILGLQERLETLQGDPSLPLFQELGHRLLTLHDTQIALVKLLQHAHVIHGINVSWKPLEAVSRATAVEETRLGSSNAVNQFEEGIANQRQDQPKVEPDNDPETTTTQPSTVAAQSSPAEEEFSSPPSHQHVVSEYP
ncbi:hypothetical protein BCR34DRAFT_592479, partial [Clohesyomyces aquaticus]